MRNRSLRSTLRGYTSSSKVFAGRCPSTLPRSRSRPLSSYRHLLVLSVRSLFKHSPRISIRLTNTKIGWSGREDTHQSHAIGTIAHPADSRLAMAGAPSCTAPPPLLVSPHVHMHTAPEPTLDHTPNQTFTISLRPTSPSSQFPYIPIPSSLLQFQQIAKSTHRIVNSQTPTLLSTSIHNVRVHPCHLPRAAGPFCLQPHMSCESPISRGSTRTRGWWGGSIVGPFADDN